jgi:hypothetical protein
MATYYFRCKECKAKIGKPFNDAAYEQQSGNKPACPVSPGHHVVIRSDDLLKDIFAV